MRHKEIAVGMMKNIHFDNLWETIPVEISVKIFSYVYPNVVIGNEDRVNYGPEHYEQYVNVLPNIPLCAAKIGSEVLVSRWSYYRAEPDSDFPISFEGWIHRDTDFDKRFFMVKELSNCNCCEKHKTRRPTLEQFKTGQYQEVSSNAITGDVDVQWHTCSCTCRHMCRQFCRVQVSRYRQFCKQIHDAEAQGKENPMTPSQQEEFSHCTLTYDNSAE